MEQLGDLQRQYWKARKGGVGVHKAQAKLRRALVEHRITEAESSTILTAVGQSPGSSRSNSPAVRTSTPVRSRSRSPKVVIKKLSAKLLLRLGEVQSAEYVTGADISGRNLQGVIQGDLKKFTAMTYLDAGDNNISINELTELSGLEELHLHCNGVANITLPTPSYPALRILDLSFNKLTSKQISNLSAIPNLRELDLTHNGLKAVPASLALLPSLESLVLEDNILTDSPSLWRNLGCVETLRAVILDGNRISSIISPEDIESDVFFPSIEFLSLARNNIDQSDKLCGLLFMESLREVVLADNHFIRVARRGAPMPIIDTIATRGVSVVLHPGTIHIAPEWDRPVTAASSQADGAAEIIKRIVAYSKWVEDIVMGEDEESVEVVKWRHNRAQTLLKKRKERRERRKKEKEENSRRGDLQFFLTAVPGQESESESEEDEEDEVDPIMAERLRKHRERGVHISDTAVNAMIGPNDDPVVDSILSLPSQTGAAINPDEPSMRSLYAALKFALDHPVQVSLLPGDLTVDVSDGVVRKDENMLEMAAIEGLELKTSKPKPSAIQAKKRLPEASVDDLIFDIRQRLATVEDNLATVVSAHGTSTNQ